MNTLTTITHSALCGTQHHTWNGVGNSFFCKFYCFQDYHCLQMADQGSMEMLVFRFASRTFADKRVVQYLSKSVSAFPSFMQEYLDPFVKLTNALNTWTILGSQPTVLRILPENSVCLPVHSPSRIQLTIKKCHFGVRQLEFLGRTISPKKISPQVRKIQQFLGKLRFVKSKNPYSATWES